MSNINTVASTEKAEQLRSAFNTLVELIGTEYFDLDNSTNIIQELENLKSNLDFENMTASGDSVSDAINRLYYDLNFLKELDSDVTNVIPFILMLG